jgi:lipid A 3-O-deacylase
MAVRPGWAQEPTDEAAQPSSTGMDECLSGVDGEQRIPLPGWHFAWENDSVISPGNSDEFYTQGIRLGYRFRPDSTPAFLSRPMNALCAQLSKVSKPGHKKLVGAGSVFIGQHLFTPGDLRPSALIPDDRPYAAWLYAGARLEIAQPIEESGRLFKTGLFHTFELQVGITGKHAQGEWVQSNWHKLIHSQNPNGWDNQLPSEAGIQARYQFRGLVADHPFGSSNWQLQGTLDGGFDAGTIRIAADAGTTWRFGRNLGDDIASRLTPKIALKADGSAMSTSESIDDNLTRQRRDEVPCATGRGLFAIEECYVYLGVLGHAIGFNAFLDGTFFHGGHSVEKEPFMFDVVWGSRLRWKHIQLDYAAVRTSREFFPVPQISSNRSGKHSYGALNLRCIASVGSRRSNWEYVCPGIFTVLLAAVAAQ